jgi:hypothetical protein
VKINSNRFAMAWLEGLSTLKGQITSFTKEVLSEGRDELHGNSFILLAECCYSITVVSGLYAWLILCTH